MEYPATEKLKNYLKDRRQPDGLTDYMLLLLEAIREGGVREINVKGYKYEVYADILETEI